MTEIEVQIILVLKGTKNNFFHFGPRKITDHKHLIFFRNECEHIRVLCYFYLKNVQIN